MLDIIQFIFADFLHFIGFLIIMAVFFDGIVEVIEAYGKLRRDDEE